MDLSYKDVSRWLINTFFNLEIKKAPLKNLKFLRSTFDFSPSIALKRRLSSLGFQTIPKLDSTVTLA